MQRRGWAKRFEDRTKSSPLLVLLFFASTSLSAAIVLATGGIGMTEWYDRTFDWRDDEYEKLENLHAGFTRAKFVEDLGTPVFDRRSGRFREETFRRREYWVQAVSDRSGVVVVYSVTACGSEFRPRFPIPGSSSYDEPVASVEVNESRLTDVIDERDVGLQLDYAGSGATGNSRFHEIFGGGNPSNYKTFIWGLNDICADWFDVYGGFYDDGFFPRRAPAIFKGALATAPAWVGRFRRRAVVNTYAETAPLFKLRMLRGSFQIGADRLLTRTAQDADARLDTPE